MDILIARCIWIIPCLMLGWPTLSVAAQDVSDMKIAGHRLIKVYDDNSTGVKMNGSGPIFQDRSGRYWLATFPKGVYLFDEEKKLWKLFTRESGELIYNRISRIGQSNDNRLWFVHWQQFADMTWFDGERWQKLRLDYKQPNLKRRVSALFAGRDSRLWFAIEHELVCLDNQAWSTPLNLPELIDGWRPLPPHLAAEVITNTKDWREVEKQLTQPQIRNTITAGLQDKEGYIWLGTYSGIARFDERKGEWKRYTRDKTTLIDTIYEDHKNRIWFTDRRGKVEMYDKQKDSWTFFDLQDHLTDDRKVEFLNLTSVYQDRAGRMMFGTFRGLVVFDERKNDWEILTSQNSILPDDAIYTIFENKAGNIWISTAKGIVVVEP